MSVLGSSKLRSSFRNLKFGSGVEEEPNNPDLGIFYQTFAHHWEACRDRIHSFEPLSDKVQDDILTVGAQLEQMHQLLQMELQCCGGTSGDSSLSVSTSAILDMLLSSQDSILAQVVSWLKSLPPSVTPSLLLLLLNFFQTLLAVERQGQSVLSHVKVLQPLLSLLELINSLTTTEEFSFEVQSCLLSLVHTLFVLLMEQAAFLDLFTVHAPDSPPRFILLSLLTPYLHKGGQLGQAARDSLLLCISLSSRHSSLSSFLSDHSTFCPLLASGLSGLFSSLPQNLAISSPTWHRIDPGDSQDVEGLETLLISLELCSAVAELSSSQVSGKLLTLVHQAFLTPVLGPALVQNQETDAIVAITAYTDLFIRRITAPSLLAVVVRFLLTELVDGENILSVLIGRLQSPSSQLALVTLALFESLISLNMEDVLLCLVFQHLLPGHFLLPSCRRQLETSWLNDPHGRAALKFLSLVPVSCDPPSTPVTPRRLSISPRNGPQSLPVISPSRHYSSYLTDARNVIRSTHRDCLQWRHQYDGRETVKEPFKAKTSLDLGRLRAEPELMKDPLEELATSSQSQDCYVSLGGESSGYLSGSWADVDITDEQAGSEIPKEVVLTPEEEKEFWSAVGYQDGTEGTRQKLHTLLARIQHEDRLSEVSGGQDSLDIEASPRVGSNDSKAESEDGASLGPFLSVLLERVSNFSSNSLGVNLRLTALVSKLATFPCPLLKVILIQPDVVVQPSCWTLIQAICTARLRIDSIMPGLLGAEEAVKQARDDLAARIQPPSRNSTSSLMSLPAVVGELSLRRSSNSFLRTFSDRFSRKERISSSSSNNSIIEENKQSSFSIPPHTRQMAMAAVLLEEWLQELAALSQEHAVLQQAIS